MTDDSLYKRLSRVGSAERVDLFAERWESGEEEEEEEEGGGARRGVLRGAAARVVLRRVPYRYDEVWDDLWWLESSRFEREPARRCELMSPEEMQMYEALPTPVRIYRGYGEWTSEDYDPSEMWQGYSWTLDRDRAVRFAKRFTVLHGAPRIASATISREHIVALFEERNESELIVLPKHIVGHVQIRPLGL